MNLGMCIRGSGTVSMGSDVCDTMDILKCNLAYLICGPRRMKIGTTLASSPDLIQAAEVARQQEPSRLLIGDSDSHILSFW